MKRIIKITTKIACFVLASLMVFIVVFNLACFIKGKVTGEQCPLVFGFGCAVVISGSMEDTISAYDVVIVHRQAEYQVDDIVVYQGNTYCVTHRIIDMQTDETGQRWVTTQGDFNNAPDDPIPYENIIGKVLFWIPNVGYFKHFLQTPLGFLTLTLLAAAAFKMLSSAIALNGIILVKKRKHEAI